MARTSDLSLFGVKDPILALVRPNHLPLQGLLPGVTNLIKTGITILQYIHISSLTPSLLSHYLQYNTSHIMLHAHVMVTRGGYA